MTHSIRLTRIRNPRLAGALAIAATLAFIGAGCTSSSSSATKTATSTATGANPTAKAMFAFRALDAGGPLTVGALKNGSIDIAELFTFSPDIAKNGWVTLKDDKHLQAADNFVPLIRTAKVTPAISTVLDAVSAKMTQKGVFDLVTDVAVNGQNPDDVAQKWLTDNNLPGAHKATGTLTVGTANFAESEIVGQIYGDALKAAGVTVTMKTDIGARQVSMPLMENGGIDVMPEFTFSLLAYLNPKAESSSDLTKVTKELQVAVKSKNLTVLTPSNVSDVNVFVVTKATAAKYNLVNISDLAKVPTKLTLGAPPECTQNSQCIPGLEKVYGLRFRTK